MIGKKQNMKPTVGLEELLDQVYVVDAHSKNVKPIQELSDRNNIYCGHS